MAFVVFKNGKGKSVSHRAGVEIFLMQRGQLQGTSKQKVFVKNVKRVYLPWDTAPQVYRERYPRQQGRVVKQIALPYKDV